MKCVTILEACALSDVPIFLGHNYRPPTSRDWTSNAGPEELLYCRTQYANPSEYGHQKQTYSQRQKFKVSKLRSASTLGVRTSPSFSSINMYAFCPTHCESKRFIDTDCGENSTHCGQIPTGFSSLARNTVEGPPLWYVLALFHSMHP